MLWFPLFLFVVGLCVCVFFCAFCFVQFFGGVEFYLGWKCRAEVVSIDIFSGLNGDIVQNFYRESKEFGDFLLVNIASMNVHVSCLCLKRAVNVPSGFFEKSKGMLHVQ